MTERLKQIKLVGRGAMAEVYRGVLAGERGVQKPVAIKRLRPELQKDPRAVDLFVNEASITVRLAHPNVIQGLEFARDSDGYYLVCEWLDCVTLAELAKKPSKLPWTAVALIGQSLAQALAYIHDLTDADGSSLAVIHRDVNPGNVLLTKEGGIKLTDFGVACCRARPCPVNVREAGTPGFTAPEQRNRGECDQKSDIFGLGATLSALAAGIDADLPAPLATVIDKARAESAADRFPSAQALFQALLAATEASRKPSDAIDNGLLRDLYAELAASPAPAAPQLDGALQSILGQALVDTGPVAPSVTARARQTRRTRNLAIAVASAAMVVGVVALALPRFLNGEAPSESTTPAAPPPLSSYDPALEATSRPSEPQTKEPTPAKTLPADPRPVIRPKIITTLVNVNAVPWAEVVIDGRRAGNTPLREVKLSVGTHQFVLSHPPDGSKRAFAVEVEAGDGQTLLFNLTTGVFSKKAAP